MNRDELIAEARAHLERAADAAPKSARRAILVGEAEDQRLSLVARLASALEQAPPQTARTGANDESALRRDIPDAGSCSGGRRPRA